MDNNILASNYGLQQIEKIIKLGVKVDFNQGLDARLITDEIARLLAKVKWIKRIRFGCDTPGQIAEVERASALIDKYGDIKGNISCIASLWTLKSRLRVSTTGNLKAAVFSHTVNPFVI